MLRLRCATRAGAEYPVTVLYSGPGQLNCVLPARGRVGNRDPHRAQGGVAGRRGYPAGRAGCPGLFTLNPAGLVAASLVRSKPGQADAWEPVFQADDAGNIVAKPLVFGEEGEALSLVLYCTGVRGRSSPGRGHCGGRRPERARLLRGPQPEYAGLDQINIILPRSLAGAGSVGVRVEVDGSVSNAGSLTFR